MSKTFTFKRSEYLDNGNLAIAAFELDGDHYNYYGKLTVNITPLLSDCACVDTNNWPDAEQVIKDNDLGKPLGRSVRSGFCEYPIYQFNLDKIEKM